MRSLRRGRRLYWRLPTFTARTQNNYVILSRACFVRVLFVDFTQCFGNRQLSSARLLTAQVSFSIGRLPPRAKRAKSYPFLAIWAVNLLKFGHLSSRAKRSDKIAILQENYDETDVAVQLRAKRARSHRFVAVVVVEICSDLCIYSVF